MHRNVSIGICTHTLHFEVRSTSHVDLHIGLCAIAPWILVLHGFIAEYLTTASLCKELCLETESQYARTHHIWLMASLIIIRPIFPTNNTETNIYGRPMSLVSQYQVAILECCALVADTCALQTHVRSILIIILWKGTIIIIVPIIIMFWTILYAICVYYCLNARLPSRVSFVALVLFRIQGNGVNTGCCMCYKLDQLRCVFRNYFHIIGRVLLQCGLQWSPGLYSW